MHDCNSVPNRCFVPKNELAARFRPLLADFFSDPQGEKMRFRQEDFQTFVAFGIECLEAFFADLL